MRHNRPPFLHRICTLFVLVTFSLTLAPVSLPGQKIVSTSKNLPLKSDVINRRKNPINTGEKRDNSIFFEENRGQHHEKVKFASRRGRETVYLTPTEAVFMLPIADETENKAFEKFDLVNDWSLEKQFSATNKIPISEKERPAKRSKPRKFVPLKMKMIGANPQAKVKGTEETPTKVNYFKGNDESKHRTDIPTFGRVVYENVYEGIGLEWYGTAEGEYEYDFKVKPNADINRIELQFEGASKLETDTEGNLLIYTKAGIVRQNKPYSYQRINGEQKEVGSNFEVKSENKVSFTVESYDKQKELTIDPTLVYSTYIGGSGYYPFITPREGGDYLSAIAVDTQGNAIIGSQTYSTDYPVTAGSYDTTINGNADTIISRFSPDGRTLVYSTFIGGEGEEYSGGELKIDSQGNICAAVSSASTDFPTTPGVFQRRHNGGIASLNGIPLDVVIFKLPPQGNQLIFSTFFGGTSPSVGFGRDVIGALTLDAQDNIYITGNTDSANFPVSANAYQTQLRHPQIYDAFVAKLNAAGSAMIFSTYFGGANSGENPLGIDVDAAGNVYITGTTTSLDLPTTPGAFDRTYNLPINSEHDGFVTKFDPNLSGLVYSTYLGGSRDNELRKIKVDNQGQAYIFGGTSSFNFPVTPNAYSTTSFGAAVLTKLNQSGSALLYSTYFPAGGVDMILEDNGNLILAGYAGSRPIFTPNAFDRSPDSDAGLIRFNPSTNQILYATAFGGKMGDPTFDGNHYDGAVSVAKDGAGNIYLAGGTGTSDFPTTEGAFDRTWNRYHDGFVAKFSFAPNSITNLSGRTRKPTPLHTLTKGISRIRIKLTDNTTGEVRYQMTRPTGRYEFRGLPANRNYTIEVSDKRRFTNTSETIQNAEGDIGGIDFVLAP